MTQHHLKKTQASTRAKIVAGASVAYELLTNHSHSEGIANILPDGPDSQVKWYQLDQLIPSPHQPRRYFDPQYLQQLADSFATHGCKSVIVIRPHTDNLYEIVAGERRFRAAKMAGLEQVLCLVTHLTDEEAFEFALVENEHREDLSSLELTHGILNLIDLKHQIPRERAIHLIRTEGHHRKQAYGGNMSTSPELRNIIQVIESFGLKLETFRTRHLKLLDLPNELRDAHLQGKLGMNHALVLNRVKDLKVRENLLNETIEQGLSVQKLNERLKGTGKASKPKKIKQVGQEPPPEIIKLWNKLKIAPIWNDAQVIEKLYSAMSDALGGETATPS